MSAIERLERIAKRVSWKLFWKTEDDVHSPAMVYRSLDISQRGRPVLLDGPRWMRVRSTEVETASEKIAAVILAALPRSGGRR